MIYQLPSGKILYLSLEDYLSLTDQDLQDLIAINAGDYPKSIWEASSLHIKKITREIIENELDYQEDSEEIKTHIISIHSLTIDEIDFSEDQEDSSNEEDN